MSAQPNPAAPLTQYKERMHPAVQKQVEAATAEVGAADATEVRSRSPSVESLIVTVPLSTS